MKKRLFAAITAAGILCSLCACAPRETPAGNETTTGITTEPTDAPAYPALLSYEAYMEMTPAQQQAYYETFPDQATYMQWFNNAALAYREDQGEEGDNKVEGNVGVITQPTDIEETDTPETPTTKPEEKPDGPTVKPESPTTKQEEPTQKPTVGSQEEKDPVLLTYEEYLKLTPSQQQAYYKTFPDHNAYMQWFNQATKDYNQEKNEDKQIGQSTKPESESTVPNNGGVSGLEGVGGAGSGRPNNP